MFFGVEEDVEIQLFQLYIKVARQLTSFQLEHIIPYYKYMPTRVRQADLIDSNARAMPMSSKPSSARRVNAYTGLSFLPIPRTTL
jgi:hypothetical protein